MRRKLASIFNQAPPASSTLAEEVMAVNASGPFTIWQRCDAAVSSITPLLAPRQLHGQSLNQRPVKPRPSDHSPPALPKHPKPLARESFNSPGCNCWSEEGRHS